MNEDKVGNMKDDTGEAESGQVEGCTECHAGDFGLYHEGARKP